HLLPPPASTLFPYTTLFRSSRSTPRLGGRSSGSSATAAIVSGCAGSASGDPGRRPRFQRRTRAGPSPRHPCVCRADRGNVSLVRSEEHTSELQSRENLVCRL